MYLYKITNIVTNTFYIGVTSYSLNQRFSAHKCAAKRNDPNKRSKLYDAMRSYGINNFKIELLGSFATKDAMFDAEKRILEYINLVGIKNYNIKAGGEHIFSIKDKNAWKAKLREKRKGKTPALGMKHTEENKRKFGEFGKQRWDLYGRYPTDVLNHGFTKANKLYGISKTHYYRLRNQANSNEVS